ncbi:MAG TPA: condensation domain-containing protein [Micromonosporaceae bacterium]
MTGTPPADALLFPASSAQRQLWFLEQLYPGQPLNNLNMELRPAVELRPESLRAALTALVDRHEALRTTFHVHDDELVQAVAPAAGTVALAVSDLRDLAEPQARERLARLRHDDGSALFDLAEGPLLRTRLVYLPGGAQALILVVHHIVADATSVGVLVEDLGALYQAATDGVEADLPPLRIQYVDYAAWQQKRQEHPKVVGCVQWWRDRLRDLPTVDLMPGRPRPTGSLNSGGWYAEVWDAAFVDEVRALARAHAATVFGVLLAGYAVLLHGYTGGVDLPIGTPALGRPTAELRRVVGLFVNMLVLRVDVSGEPSFAELLTRARRTVQDALAHEDAPFERIVEAVAPARALGVTALFQVGINMVPAPPPTRAGQAAFLSGGTEFSNGTAKYDLFLTFNEQPGGGLEVVVEWRRGLLPDEIARAVPGELRRILTGALADPGVPVGTLAPDRPAPTPTPVDVDVPDRATRAGGDSRPDVERIERVLAEAFASVLGQPTVDRTTSFFALGGDSMASLRLVGAAAEAGVRIAPSDVFLYQTVAELARVADVSPDVGSPDGSPDLEPEPARGETVDSSPDGTHGYRASDFPDAGLSQNQLDRLVARLAVASNRAAHPDDQTP